MIKDNQPQQDPPSHDSSETLPTDVLERVNKTCDDFEQALKRGDFPRIEDYLGEAAGEERKHLLRELLHLELDYNRTVTETRLAADYQSRFGKALVDSIVKSRLEKAETASPRPTESHLEVPSIGVGARGSLERATECPTRQLESGRRHLSRNRRDRHDLVETRLFLAEWTHRVLQGILQSPASVRRRFFSIESSGDKA